MPEGRHAARERNRGTRRRLSLALAVSLGAPAQADPLRAEAPTFADFSYAIYRQYEGIDHACYFSQLDSDGRATYMTPDRQVGVISIDGAAEQVGGDQAGSCRDRTLDDLRASGQALDLVR
jgi:hypothetical protein